MYFKIYCKRIKNSSSVEGLNKTTFIYSIPLVQKSTQPSLVRSRLLGQQVTHTIDGTRQNCASHQYYMWGAITPNNNPTLDSPLKISTGQFRRKILV